MRLGSAAGRLGLAGRVEPEPFRRLLDAADPHTGDPLGVPRTTDRRLAGFDLCFSAPKSVSVAWALSPPEVTDAIAAAHDRAVAQAVDVFETEVALPGRPPRRADRDPRRHLGTGPQRQRRHRRHRPGAV